MTACEEVAPSLPQFASWHQPQDASGVESVPPRVNSRPVARVSPLRRPVQRRRHEREEVEEEEEPPLRKYISKYKIL